LTAFTVSAVAFAFALLSMPSPQRDLGEISIAASIAGLVVGVSMLSRFAPALSRIGVTLGYVALVAILIDGSGGNNSGFGGLFLLPVVWLASFGTIWELLLLLAAVGVARLVPLLAIGAPAYPPSGWRAALVLGIVAAIAGFTIQHLIRAGRLRAAELAERSRELEDAGRLLAAQNDKLREFDQLKDEFVALVSHELRTPLTSVVGFLEMINEDEPGTLSENQQQYLLTVQRNVERLIRLVNDLLFLSKLDSGVLHLQPTQADLNQLLAEAAEAAEPAANRKRIELILTSEPLPPVRCDQARIAQLLDNLISNAIKFTPEGGQVELRGRQNGDQVTLSVSDTGIGIPGDELPLLFDRFFRASTATANAIPGTGLGLAISQAIAQAHATTIEVESTLELGTTFRLRLPAIAQPALRTPDNHARKQEPSQNELPSRALGAVAQRGASAA
jgi:signal transduction histidine kinase